MRSKATVEWNRITLALMLLAGIPLLQWGAGILPFAGQAWISATYLLGATLAVLTGQAWERDRADQAANALFLAIGIGGVVSVGLQLMTWLGGQGNGVEDIWSMGLTDGRPYANMGQPNQLATLLLWGVLGAIWAYQNSKIGMATAGGMSAFLLLGVAMTQSRTAWLGLSLIVLATWIWRHHWKSPRLPWLVLCLFVLFWTFPLLLRWVNALLLMDQNAQFLRLSVAGESRHVAWLMFAKAALARPWFGYGWTEVASAQMAVAADLPGLKMTFGHAHNLFMDLVLWLGIPLGVLLSLAIVAAFVGYVRSVRNANDLILVLFLGVIGIHAMLELPLHYAYFLLPTALVVGILNVRSGVPAIWMTGRWMMAASLMVAMVLYAGIVRDYFRVEASYQSLRFERARIGTLPIGKPPDVIFLTQLRDQIRFMRLDFSRGMSAEDIQWVMDVANTYPSAGSVYNVAGALALNDRPQEAGLWLRKICKISSQQECELVRQAWLQDGKGNHRIAAVPWPS